MKKESSFAARPLSGENMFPIGELPQRLSKGIGGRHVHPSTVSRWASRGLRGGIKLEVFRLGGQLMTSTEAVKRFLEKVNR